MKRKTIATLVGATGTWSAQDPNADLTYGPDASFDMTRNASLRAEWQRFNDMGGNDAGKPGVDLPTRALHRF